MLGSNSPEAGTISNLSVEVEAGIADVDVIAARLQEVALDLIKSHDAAKAREAADFAQFVAKRLRNVLPRLEQRHQQMIAQERCTRRPS